MELIILNDGVYQLVPVTKEILKGIEIISEVTCFDVCDILRLKLTGYVDSINPVSYTHLTLPTIYSV